MQVAVVDLKTIFESEETPVSREIAGLTVRELRRAERMRLALPDKGGVLVVQVAETSPLHGKISPGEVILRAREEIMDLDQRVQHIDAFERGMEKLKTGGGYLDVLRKGVVEAVTVPAA